MTTRSDLSAYGWNERSARYTDDRGRFVSSREVRAEMERVVEGVKGEIKALGRGLAEGNLSLNGWQTLMAEQVQTLHLMSTAAARGGWAQLTPVDLDRVASATDKQLGYLQGFAVEVEQGKQAVTGIERRAGLYAEAGRATFEAERGAVEEEHGSNEMRNVLGSADHCVGCLEATASGWVEIGEISLPGERECGPNCHCEVEYR